jgi:hypothetical protein
MAFVMLGCGFSLHGASSPKPRVDFSPSASLFKHLASMQAKPPCLAGTLLFLNSLPASPTARTADFSLEFNLFFLKNNCQQSLNRLNIQ